MKFVTAYLNALAESKKSDLELVIVDEGPHADEFAECGTDGKSYGFCPTSAKDTLYPHGKVVGFVLGDTGVMTDAMSTRLLFQALNDLMASVAAFSKTVPEGQYIDQVDMLNAQHALDIAGKFLSKSRAS